MDDEFVHNHGANAALTRDDTTNIVDLERNDKNLNDKDRLLKMRNQNINFCDYNYERRRRSNSCDDNIATAHNCNASDDDDNSDCDDNNKEENKVISECILATMNYNKKLSKKQEQKRRNYDFCSNSSSSSSSGSCSHQFKVKACSSPLTSKFEDERGFIIAGQNYGSRDINNQPSCSTNYDNNREEGDRKKLDDDASSVATSNASAISTDNANLERFNILKHRRNKHDASLNSCNC